VLGTPSGLHAAGGLRPVEGADMQACRAAAESAGAVFREAELAEAIGAGTARLVERDGAVRGYAAGLGLRGHAIAAGEDDLIALLAATPPLPGPGFFLPIRFAAALRWTLAAGLRLGWPALLMTRGSYAPPRGAFLPSIAF